MNYTQILSFILLFPSIMVASPTWTKVSTNELSHFNDDESRYRNFVSMNDSAQDRLRYQPTYAQNVGDSLYFLVNEKFKDSTCELIVTDRRFNVQSRYSIELPSGTAAKGWFVDDQAVYIVSHNWGGFYFEPRNFKTYVTRYDLGTGKSIRSRNFDESLDLEMQNLSDETLLLTFGRNNGGSEYGRFVILGKSDLRTHRSMNIRERPLTTIVSKGNYFGAGYIFPEFYDTKGNRIFKDLEELNQGVGSFLTTSNPHQFAFVQMEKLFRLDTNRKCSQSNPIERSKDYSPIVCSLGDSIYSGLVHFQDGAAVKMARIFGSGPDAFEIPAVGRYFRDDYRSLACQGRRAAYTPIGQVNAVEIFELDSQNQIHQSRVEVDIRAEHMVWVSDDLLMFWKYTSQNSEIGLLDFKN